MQRRNPERRAQQEMRRIAQAEGTGGRYASGPGAGFGGSVGQMVAGTWTSFGRVGITPLSAFAVAPASSSAEPHGRIGLTPLSEFRVA